MLKQHHFIIPDGLTTMLEGLSRAVLKKRPEDIKLFALYYLAELRKYRDEKPSFDIKTLVREFHKSRAERLRAVDFDEDLRIMGFGVKPPGSTGSIQEEPDFTSGKVDEKSGPCAAQDQGALAFRTPITETTSQVNGGRPKSINPQSSPSVPATSHHCVPSADEGSRSSALNAVRRKENQVKQVDVVGASTCEERASEGLTNKVQEGSMEMPQNKSFRSDGDSNVSVSQTAKTPVAETKAIMHVNVPSQSPRPQTATSSHKPSTGDKVGNAATSDWIEGRNCCVAQDSPSAKPRRVKIAWTPMVGESINTSRRCAGSHGEDTVNNAPTTYVQRSDRFGAEHLLDTFHEIPEPSNAAGTNYHCNREQQVWGYYPQGIMYSPRQRQVPCCLDHQQRPPRQYVCHHPVSHGYNYYTGVPREAIYNPVTRQQQPCGNCVPICQPPQAAPCQCTAESFPMPPCVTVKPYPAARSKRHNKPCRGQAASCFMNEDLTATEQRFVYSNPLSRHHVPPRRECGHTQAFCNGLPGQRYEHVYMPMGEQHLPHIMKPAHSSLFVPTSCVVDAEYLNVTKRRPCSALLKRVAFSEPTCGGLCSCESGYSRKD